MKTIIRLDASSLKSASCLRRLYLKTVHGYRGRDSSSQLLYGTCFHYFAEEIETRPADAHTVMQEMQLKFATEMQTATVAKGKEYMDVMHLTRTCLAYKEHKEQNEAAAFEVLRSPLDDKPLVEVKFSMPLAVIGQYEFLLQGTIDRIAKIKNGCLCLRDYKTTSLKDPYKYFSAEKMSPQMKTYSYAVRSMALAYPDGLFGRLLAVNPSIGCFIDGVFLDPKSASQFSSSNASFYSLQELTEFGRWLQSICARLATVLDTGEWPEPEGTFNDTCRSAFGSFCPFLDVCAAQQNWAVSKSMLDAHMLVKAYTPLNFGGGNKVTV